MVEHKQDIIQALKRDLLHWQGFKAPKIDHIKTTGLEAIEAAFPQGVLPTGALHEFLCASPEHAAASGGFIAGLLGTLMRQGGACLWISLSRRLFPPALKAFGVEPERVIFVDLVNERDLLWATEEALKYEGLSAVVTELREISFAQSRRLQLVVERSKVTGFLLRDDPSKVSATTCVARWRITPLPSALDDGLPGVGFPRWNVELLKVRNGNPGNWLIEWSDSQFNPIPDTAQQAPAATKLKKAG